MRPAGVTRVVTVAGLLLAAGASRRLGTPKQLLTDDQGMPLVRRMADLLRQAGCDPVVVVTGAHHERVSAALHGDAVHLVFNAQWAEGMGASIAAGMAAVPVTHGVLIAPCDMPMITAAHLMALHARFVTAGGVARVASAYRRNETGDAADPPVVGIPALLPASDRELLRALQGDRGARDLLRTPETLTVTLTGGASDLDTPSDVRRWREATSHGEESHDGR